jgi:hypothetical protein
MGIDKGREFLAKERYEQEKNHYLVNQKVWPIESLSLECLKIVDP